MGSAKILVVEDESIVALDIQAHLARLGYTILEPAVSGEEAIQRVAVAKPDLVLMDIRLQGKLDGIQTAARIQDEFEIPVVYLTAHTDTATLQRAKATAPFGYIVKPFSERELDTAIELALYKHQLESRERIYVQRLEQEILHRQRVETELRSSEMRYRTLVDTSPDAIALIDLEGNLLMVNDQMARLFGFDSPEDFLLSGKTMCDLVVSEDRLRAPW